MRTTLISSCTCRLWKGLAVTFVVVLALAITSTQYLAQSGGVTDNSGFIPFDQAFFAFEVESPLGTLKEVPIWDEIEQMLDNPYAFALDSSVRGNDQDWPSYRLTQSRRRSFIYRNGAGQPCAPASSGCVEVPLDRHIIHPLNYNHSTGEELRLLNPEFEGLACLDPDTDTSDCWIVPDHLEPQGDGSYQWMYRYIPVSPGEDRVEEDEASTDFNSPIATDTETCITSVDQYFLGGPSEFFSAGPASGGPPLPEGTVVCGGDPGEPGYLGFGVLELAEIDDMYSTPAVPGKTGPEHVLTSSDRLFDPSGCLERNAESPGSCTDPGYINRLRKPTLRPTPGGPPDYLQNSVTNLAADPTALTPSNENDYFKGNTRGQKETARNEAAALGKALFWDMQVGSDTVQACASCHFHAGADNRTKNQTNPNHVGGDNTLQVHPNTTQGQNSDLVRSDFPFSNGGDAERFNDVASSMGVRFRRFTDIRMPGGSAFNTCPPSTPTCVRTLLPDLGIADPDPIPLFQGLRRVEPRNTPTLFNAAMNFDNFWDGRARHDFNGGSVFGATDPQHHVFVADGPTTSLEATRQIIRFVSLASLAPGPALSDFEMSFAGRNWAKLGKKLLQGSGIAGNLTSSVTPLANQLVALNDSVLGRYSNQGGSACASLPSVDRVLSGGATATGKPGLCISYPGLIRRAFYPALWQSSNQRLRGCYTNDGDPTTPQNTPVCATTPFIPVLEAGTTLNETNTHDPFDGYVLTAETGFPTTTNTNQFSQMEANMPLFFGLSIHAWGTFLVPDDTPMDRFFDANPDSFATFGESGEPGIALDLRNCSGPNGTGGVQPCFTEVGNFKRDPGVSARINCAPEDMDSCTVVPAGGTRVGGVDPLMGLDFFLGSNLSLKNPNFRSLRCGECHAGGTLTDHTFEISHQVSFGDRIQEFRTGMPGVELFPEALGRGRVISGFLLEGELQENAQDGIERNVADFELDFGGFPQGQALFDNGVYNIGVTPIGNDVSRGGRDPFGWPLSLSYLAFKNLGGLDYSPGGDVPPSFDQPSSPGNPLPNFDPAIDPTSGGLFEPTAQDQLINPGFAEEPADPLLPPYLAPWASNIPVGDESNIDEVFVGLNTLMEEPMLEGFVDSWGPFNPAAILGESFNNARQPEMAMWPNVNRVNTQGSFKAPPLRHVSRTGPYFHNGGKLTLRQVVDFYARGGDFPETNAAHRDFLIVNLLEEDEALGGLDPATLLPEFTPQEKEEILVSVVDFLLELTDERVDFQRAPFDQPEIFVPLDGKAPDNTFGRSGFVALTSGECDATDVSPGACFGRIPQTGQGGKGTPTPNFLQVLDGPRLVGGAASCGPAPTNHYCH